jgi:hypothetical protein
VSITTTSTCAWSAVPTVTWITLTTPASGTGGGSVGYTVAANTSTTARNGAIAISGATFAVTQAGAAPACMVTINPMSQSVGKGGSNGFNVSVTAGSTCGWTATSNAFWITINSGLSGTGNGTVRVAVADNTGPARTGTATIGGQPLTVTQSDGCTYSISPTSQTLSRAAGPGGPISVTAGAGCLWTAQTTATWIHVTSGATGSGNGTVTFTVDEFNMGGNSRNGTITIGGENFTVKQDKNQ